MKNILISVLMANRNNQKYISQSIESLISQTYQNWELIIVDDCSSDNSPSIAYAYLKDQRIKYYRNKERLYCGGAKKYAASKASGSIFVVLDSDDILLSSALHCLVQSHIESIDSGLIYSNHSYIDEKGRVIGKNLWTGEVESGSTHLHEIKAHHVLSFKEKYYNMCGGFSDEFRVAEDKDLIYKIEEVSKTRHIDGELYCYRIHNNSISQKGAKANLSKTYDIKAKYSAFLRRKNNGFHSLSEERMAELLYEGAARSVLGFNIINFLWFFQKAFKLNRNMFRGVVVILNKIVNKKNA